MSAQSYVAYHYLSHVSKPEEGIDPITASIVLHAVLPLNNVTDRRVLDLLRPQSIHRTIAEARRQGLLPTQKKCGCKGTVLDHHRPTCCSKLNKDIDTAIEYVERLVGEEKQKLSQAITRGQETPELIMMQAYIQQNTSSHQLAPATNAA